MTLSKEELISIEKLEKKLNARAASNNKKNNYYYQKNRVKDLGTSTSSAMRNLDTVVGWPTLAVDVQLERINCLGFYSPDEDDENTIWLNKLWKENLFESEQRNHQRDAMITGISFISVSKGDPELGEPEVVWKSENSSSITMDYDHQRGVVNSAFKRIRVSTDMLIGEFYTPETVITLRKVTGRQWEETSRQDHTLGFVPIIPIFNNPDGIYRNGRTELSPSICSYTDSAMRTLRESESMREFYSRPVRAIVGGNPNDFENLVVHGGKLHWKLDSGDILQIPTSLDDENSPLPMDFKEFSAQDPTTVLKMVEFYGRLVAREIGVPPSYMGFDTINPSSADAINASDAKLIQKSNQRIPQLKRAYKKLAEYSLAIAGRDKDENWLNTEAVFARTDTITPQAAADRLSKLNAMGIFDQELPVWVYRELGLTDTEIEQTRNYVAMKNAANIVQQLAMTTVDPLAI